MVINLSEPPGKGLAFWHLAFRPFFLTGVIFGVLAVGGWMVFLSTGVFAPDTVINPIQWHAHEMLFGFGLAIVYGFVLTAVQTWTGIPGIKGKGLVLLWSLWLAARLAILLPGKDMVWLAMAFDLLFQGFGLYLLGRSVLISRQWRNIGMAIIPLVFLVINGIYYVAAAEGDYLAQKSCLEAGIWLFALIMSVMGGRVIPFFIARRLNIQQATKRPWLEIGCQLTLIVLVASTILRVAPNTLWVIVVSALAALLQGMRLASWWHKGILKHPLLWSLFLSYLFIPLFLAAWSAADLFTWLRNDVLHLLSIGAISGLILAMISRVSLGHTGRKLETGGMMNTAFALIAVAAVMRFLPSLLPVWRLELYYLSGAAWVLAFLAFVVCYMKILTTPRVDGMPG